MKKTYKLLLINIGSALVISALFAIGFEEPLTFLIALGILSVVFGSIGVLIGLVLLAVKKEEWGKAFLISSAVSFLIGTGICGPMFMFNG